MARPAQFARLFSSTRPPKFILGHLSRASALQTAPAARASTRAFHASRPFLSAYTVGVKWEHGGDPNRLSFVGTDARGQKMKMAPSKSEGIEGVAPMQVGTISEAFERHQNAMRWRASMLFGPFWRWVRSWISTFGFPPICMSK